MKTRYTVEGLDCPNCAAALERLIEGKPGILSCRLNFITQRLAVESDLPAEELDALVCRTARDFSRDVTVNRV